MDGTGGRPSPTYTPDVEGRALGADSGSKLSMPDELEVVNDGSVGVDEPNDVTGPNSDADNVTAGSPARAAEVGITPSDDPTVNTNLYNT